MSRLLWHTISSMCTAPNNEKAVCGSTFIMEFCWPGAAGGAFLSETEFSLWGEEGEWS